MRKFPHLFFNKIQEIECEAKLENLLSISIIYCFLLLYLNLLFKLDACLNVCICLYLERFV